jgi:hypothetical protein
MSVSLGLQLGITLPLCLMGELCPQFTYQQESIVLEPINLTKKELQEITGRQKAAYQLLWLRKNGFTALLRADGTPLVSRAHFEAKMGGYLPGTKPQSYEPNFGAI